MNSEHGGGSSKHSRTYAVPTKGHAFGSVIPYTHSCQESGGNKPPGMDPNTSANAGTLSPSKKLRFSSYGSSFDSTGGDLFQVNPNLIFPSSASTAVISKPPGDALLRDVSSDSSSKSVHSGYTDTASAVSCVTHESVLPSTSPIRSPPLQVMERSGGYDPSRISASVFACNSPMPMEWSVTSNESLFSLHIENPSLARDHLHVLNGDFAKSGELLKSGELDSRSSELISFRISPPAAVGGETDRIVDEEKILTGEGDEIMNNVPRGTGNDHYHENLPSLAIWNSPNTNRPLDATSSKSFAAPKKKKSVCSSCCWMFCCCKWLSCCCKWPSCHCKWPSHCCKWPSCHCKWSSCCCKWPSCSCKWPSCCSFSSCSCISCCCRNCRRKRIASHPLKSLTDGRTDVSASKSSKWFCCFSCSLCTCR